MPDSASTISGLRLQAQGENLNTWGDPNLNNNFSRLEELISNLKALTVSADATLDNTDYVANETRNAGFILTGAGGFTLTAPAKPRVWIVKNDCTAGVTFSHGSGDTVTVAAGQVQWIATDGSDFFTAEPTDFGSSKLTNVGAGTADTDGVNLGQVVLKSGGTMTGLLTLSGAPTEDLSAATKAYVDGVAMGSISVSFAWADVTGKPTTIAGFGITDAEALMTRSVVSGDVSAAASTWYLVDTGTSARTITLPASPSSGDEIIVSDRDGNAETNNITIGRNGKTIASLAEDLAIDLNLARVRLRYDGSADWELI